MKIHRNKWNERRDKVLNEEGMEEQSLNEPIRCRQLHPEFCVMDIHSFCFFMLKNSTKHAKKYEHRLQYEAEMETKIPSYDKGLLSITHYTFHLKHSHKWAQRCG